MRWPWSRRRAAAVAERERLVPYVLVGGRQMAVDSPYLLPKDVSESNRLDLQHYMLRYVLRGNFMAPVSAPHDILDVGCGTGRWGAEMAQQFPQANVVGVDIVPPAPTDAAVRQGREDAPENYVFVQGDFTKGLPFGDNSFDFVHMRLVVMALPATAWLPVIQELRRVTRPGGWIELVDTTVTARVPGAQHWTAWAQALAKMRGIDLTAGAQVGAFLRQAGVSAVGDRAGGADRAVGRPHRPTADGRWTGRGARHGGAGRPAGTSGHEGGVRRRLGRHGGRLPHAPRHHAALLHRLRSQVGPLFRRLEASLRL
jgi:SAM-dependent methyltransferase